MAKRLERADTIICFNMPTHVAFISIMKRWLKASHSGRPEMPDGWQEKPSFSFFWKVLWLRYHYASGTRQLLTQNNDKTIIFKGHKQAESFCFDILEVCKK